MKNILIMTLISLSLFSIGYGYKVNFNMAAHENWYQPNVSALLEADDEYYLSLDKEALTWSVQLLADSYNSLQNNSSSRILELKNLVIILLLMLVLNIIFLGVLVYKRLRSKA